MWFIEMTLDKVTSPYKGQSLSKQKNVKNMLCWIRMKMQDNCVLGIVFFFVVGLVLPNAPTTNCCPLRVSSILYLPISL